MRKHEFTNIKEKYRDFSPTKSDAMSAQAKAAFLKTKIDPNQGGGLEQMVVINKQLQDYVAAKDKLATNMSKTAGVKPNSIKLPKPLSNNDSNDELEDLETDSKQKAKEDQNSPERTKQINNLYKSAGDAFKDPKTRLSNNLAIHNSRWRLRNDPQVKTQVTQEITLEDTQDFEEEFGVLGYSIDETDMFEAEYQGRKVKLNKPMRGDVKKFKVYVKNKKGNVIKVNFGHGGTSAKRPTMRIRKSNPAARRSFRARHNCDNPGPKTKARYWSCRKW